MSKMIDSMLFICYAINQESKKNNNVRDGDEKMDESKEKFMEVWEEIARDFVLLGLETDKQETWEKIKKIKREMLNVAKEVANKKFADSLPT